MVTNIRPAAAGWSCYARNTDPVSVCANRLTELGNADTDPLKWIAGRLNHLNFPFSVLIQWPLANCGDGGHAAGLVVFSEMIQRKWNFISNLPIAKSMFNTAIDRLEKIFLSPTLNWVLCQCRWSNVRHDIISENLVLSNAWCFSGCHHCAHICQP